jgi:16S rRNA A1518/A1519 N6-dimethyltransferase RsmA/KsgA/DIM1 with predicted DNA glycosylase/AP lyase activity
MELAWNISLVVCAVFFIAFTFVVAFGAPFLPILRTRISDTFKLLDLKPGDTLVELGSGDGRILLEAAKRGIKSVGYELNPLLFLYSRVLTFKYRKLIKIYWGNYWYKKWPKAEAIYVFLLQPYMGKLDERIKSSYLNKKIKLVSFAFTIPNKKPVKELNGLYLYKYGK